MKKIKLGYEVGTGNQIDIDPSHLIATGITQLAGKTVTLESLMRRSNYRGIVFKTKIGERGFSEGRIVAPFFRERSDYEFVKSLIEAYSREKLFIEKGTLMELCKGSKDLIEIEKRIDGFVSNEKIKGIKREIYVRLQHYLGNLIPQIQDANFSSVLQIEDGINIMDLEKFSEEAQSLIIESVVSEVLKTQKNTIIIIPEAWKFIPQKYNNPCKRIVESFIRQGATNHNFIWIDSQDMAGVDKIPLKQISTWILGYQSERNEVKHTLDQLPPPESHKPTVQDIMTLGTGFFYYASREITTKVYVQPYWIDDDTAKQVALGKIKVEQIKKPKELKYKDDHEPKPPHPSGKLSDETLAYVDKMIGNVQREIDEVKEKLRTKPSHDDVINQIIARIPKVTSGTTVYEIPPLEAIKKKFLQEAKDKIISDVSNISNNAKRMLKYLETRGVEVPTKELCIKCFFMKSDGGGYNQQVNEYGKELIENNFVVKNKSGRYTGSLKNQVIELIKVHEATDEEIENLYNHILMELLGEKIETISK